jgi:hypothetical protein
MTDAVKMTLGLMRGYDYDRTWSLVDQETGASLIAATDTLSLKIKAAAGASPALLTLAHQADISVSGISGINTATGTFRVVIRSADLDDIPGPPLERWSGAFVFSKEDIDALITPYAYGPCIVEPEA